jgi:PAS domain S-box-containing protein
MNEYNINEERLESAIPRLMITIRSLGQVGIGCGLLIGLYFLSSNSYLLFHTTVEMFTISVAAALFIIAWQARRIIRNNAFSFLGSINLCIAIVLMVHMMAYKGMGVFTEYPGANLATQLWIIIRYIESLGLLLFIALIGRQLNQLLALWTCLGITALLLLSVFSWKIFPACYVEGVGLTPFKIISEYINCLILLVAIALLARHRHTVASQIWWSLMGALGLSVLAGMMFTSYISVYGFANLMGHFFHLGSFYLIYQALIHSSLTRPYTILFQDLNQAREEIEKRERYFRSVLDQLQEDIRILGPDGTIMAVNETFLKTYDLRRPDVVGHCCQTLQICTNCCTGLNRCGLSLVFSEGVSFHRIDEHRRSDGKIVYKDIHFSPLRDEKGAVYQAIAAARDVTQMIEARKSEERRVAKINTITESIAEAILALDENWQLLHVNSNFLGMWKTSRHELEKVGGLGLVEIMSGFFPDPKAIRVGIQGILSTSDTVSRILHLVDGRTLEWHSHPFAIDECLNGLVWSFRDVSTQKQMEVRLADSERRLRTLVEELPISIMTFDTDGRVDFVNQYHLKVFGQNKLDSRFFIGRKITELPALVRSGRASELAPVLHGEPVIMDEVYFPETSQGFSGYQRIKAVPLFQERSIVGGILLREDITEFKRTMKELSDSLEEKVALLKEVHHRVKNNLQIVVSLLSLQGRRSENPEVINVLQDMRNRVHSMALLHETLYRSESLARINFVSYVADLCTQLFRMSCPDGNRILIEKQIDAVSLPMEQAVPCGLIINELVSNAFKHAFPEGRSGKILVKVSCLEGSRINLVVSDTGVGLNSMNDSTLKSSLGLQLVSKLAEQLGGELTWDNHNESGATFSVVFPVPV